MKVAQLLREEDESEVFYCTKRSEINRAVASMGMAESIDFAIEHHPSMDKRNYSVDQTDDEYDAIRKIIKLHTKNRPGGLGSGFLTGRFDSRKMLEQLKACLEDLGDLFDPAKENTEWPWKVALEDEAWLYK